MIKLYHHIPLQYKEGQYPQGIVFSPPRNPLFIITDVTTQVTMAVFAALLVK